MKLPKKGTMRPVKKILGGVLIASGAGFLFNISQIQSLIMENGMIYSLVLVASGYLLYISGRRD